MRVYIQAAEMCSLLLLHSASGGARGGLRALQICIDKRARSPANIDKYVLCRSGPGVERFVCAGTIFESSGQCARVLGLKGTSCLTGVCLEMDDGERLIVERVGKYWLIKWSCMPRLEFTHFIRLAQDQLFIM